MQKIYKETLKNFILALASILIIITIFEAAAQIYVYTIAKKGKLYMEDHTCGWKLLPNLDIKQLNEKGEIWHIKTDQDGIRGFSKWNSKDIRKILILGDSFAFGEGVELSDRFDSQMFKLNNMYESLNLGVSGYGTDQEFIYGRRYLADLNPGDVLLLLTCPNDFYDVLRKSFVGRAKPWFEITKSGLLKENPAQVGLKEILRDKSYIYAWVSAFLEPENDYYTSDDFKYGVRLYCRIVENETRSLLKNNVFVIIAFHGLQNLDGYKKSMVYDMIHDLSSQTNIRCIFLDDMLLKQPSQLIFLPKGHWTVQGHRIVAETLSEYLETLKK